MIRLTKSGWLAMTLVGLLVGAAHADDGGVIRISDSPPPGAAPTNGAPALPANAGPAPAAGIEGVPCDGGGPVMEGDVGRCRLCGCLRAILAYDPARGFRPPDVAHIDREAVIYYRYWPQRFYGDPAWRLTPSFPMVYMPTDTTQLGVYYARVPQWLPNPRMYPRPPRPAEWNRRVVLADQVDVSGGVVGGAVPEGAQPVPSGPQPSSPELGSPGPPPGGALQPVPQRGTLPPPPPPNALPPAPRGN
jgi:hypothetical protein